MIGRKYSRVCFGEIRRLFSRREAEKKKSTYFNQALGALDTEELVFVYCNKRTKKNKQVKQRGRAVI